VAAPVRLTPSPREKIWGSRNLAPYFPDSSAPIGEVWFLHPERLPLLVKFLFTSERLSVQVHPAGAKGKTEMWYVVRAARNARLALGFRESISRERLRAAALSGEIERLLDWKLVAAGESYFVPAGTVHAIGAGLVLCEIQQNTDVTYRLYDYGRPRELHLEQALPLCDLGPHPGPAPAGVSCEYFAVETVTLAAGAETMAQPAECHLWVVLEGDGTVGGAEFQAGEVWLLPPEPTPVRAQRPARFLRAWVPLK
jgi:mannose-6-phosphate isomerase